MCDTSYVAGYLSFGPRLSPLDILNRQCPNILLHKATLMLTFENECPETTRLSSLLRVWLLSTFILCQSCKLGSRTNRRRTKLPLNISPNRCACERV